MKARIARTLCFFLGHRWGLRVIPYGKYPCAFEECSRCGAGEWEVYE
jgi:hypothetical protein